MLTYKLCFINHRFDNLPKELELTTSQFLDFMKPRPYPKKEDVKLWIPARFNFPQRLGKHVDYVSMLVYDVDDGLEVPQHDEILWDYEYFIFHSFSSTPEKPKWRLIIPLANPIKGEHYSLIYDQIKQVFNHKIHGVPPDGYEHKYDFSQHLDKSCKDPNRAFYLPSYHYKTKPQKPIIHLGERFDFKYRVPPPPPPKPRTYPKIKHWSHHDSNGELRYGLRTNPEWRMIQGHQLGAKINGDRMVGFECPDCKRSDATYFYINGTGAYCGHQKSCNWADSLYELAKYWGKL